MFMLERWIPASHCFAFPPRIACILVFRQRGDVLLLVERFGRDLLIFRRNIVGYPMFSIAAPFVHPRQVRPLSQSGVNELFCGFVDAESERRWPLYFQTMNRRMKGASFEDFGVFSRAVTKARSCGLPVFVTMNWHYTPEQYPWLLRTIERVSALKGVHGLIVADVGLMLTLQRMGYPKKVHVSTGGAIFNAQCVDFYRGLNASRVVLDRQLACGEVREILSARYAAIQFEIFIIRSACPFVDGLCSFLHTGGILPTTTVSPRLAVVHENQNVPLGCVYLRSQLRKRAFSARSPGGEALPLRCQYRPEQFDLLGCNLCMLYELREFPRIVLKVLERGDDVSSLVSMVRAAAKMVRDDSLTKDEYRSRCRRLFARTFGKPCRRLNCYCPPHLVKRHRA